MSWARVVGSLFVALGALGFLTVADDLNHVGEVLGVGSIFAIGALLIVGSMKAGSTRFAVWGLAGAIGIGAVAGAAMDNMPVGVGGGLAVGLAVAAVVVRRRERISE